MKKFADTQTSIPKTAVAATATGLSSEASKLPGPLPEAALAALARINSRLNLKPISEQQQKPGNNYSNIQELATAAAGEISKQLQQAKTNGGEKKMDTGENSEQISGAAESGSAKVDGTAPAAATEAPKPDAAPKLARAPTAGPATTSAGAPKPGSAPVIKQGSIPVVPVIPKGLPSFSALKSSWCAPPPKAQSKPSAENPPSVKVSAPEPLPKQLLPAPEATTGEATLI